MRSLQVALAATLLLLPSLGAQAAPDRVHAQENLHVQAGQPVAFRLGPNTRKLIVRLTHPEPYRICNDRPSAAPIVVTADAVNRTGLAAGECRDFRASVISVVNEGEVQSDAHPERNRDVATGSYLALAETGPRDAPRR